MIQIIFIVIALGLFFMLLRAFTGGNSQARRKIVSRLVIIGLMVLSVWLVLTGKILGLLALAPVIGVWAHRLFQVWHLGRMARGVFKKKGKAGPQGQQQSQAQTVKTQTLEVVLDRESMIVDIMILRGLCAGCALSDLPLGVAYDIYEYCGLNDSQGADAINNMMTNRRGEDWQAIAQQEAEAVTLSKAQSRLVLGAEQGDHDVQLKKNYFELMRQVHPDKGGSARLTARLNQAKEAAFS